MSSQARLLASWICAAVLAVAAPARAEGGLDLSVASSPQAEPDPPVGWAIGAGVLTAMVPLSVGASLFASGKDQVEADLARRTAASLTIVYGLGLAPIVSHLVVREWSRAAIFGAIPLACAVGMTVLLELQPGVTFNGTREGRLSFGLLMSFATLSSGAGLADTFGARSRAIERARAKQARLPVVPAPFVTAGGGGLSVGGAF